MRASSRLSPPRRYDHQAEGSSDKRSRQPFTHSTTGFRGQPNTRGRPPFHGHAQQQQRGNVHHRTPYYNVERQRRDDDDDDYVDAAAEPSKIVDLASTLTNRYRDTGLSVDSPVLSADEASRALCTVPGPPLASPRRASSQPLSDGRVEIEGMCLLRLIASHVASADRGSESSSEGSSVDDELDAIAERFLDEEAGSPADVEPAQTNAASSSRDHHADHSDASPLTLPPRSTEAHGASMVVEQTDNDEYAISLAASDSDFGLSDAELEEFTHRSPKQEQSPPRPSSLEQHHHAVEDTPAPKHEAYEESSPTRDNAEAADESHHHVERVLVCAMDDQAYVPHSSQANLREQANVAESRRPGQNQLEDLRLFRRLSGLLSSQGLFAEAWHTVDRLRKVLAQRYNNLGMTRAILKKMAARDAGSFRSLLAFLASHAAQM